jgi:hypothetical protein
VCRTVRGPVLRVTFSSMLPNYILLCSALFFVALSFSASTVVAQEGVLPDSIDDVVVIVEEAPVEKTSDSPVEPSEAEPQIQEDQPTKPSLTSDDQVEETVVEDEPVAEEVETEQIVPEEPESCLTNSESNVQCGVMRSRTVSAFASLVQPQMFRLAPHKTLYGCVTVESLASAYDLVASQEVRNISPESGISMFAPCESPVKPGYVCQRAIDDNNACECFNTCEKLEALRVATRMLKRALKV